MASELSQIEFLLKQSIGLDAGTLGSAAIRHAVQRRAEACGMAGLDGLGAYWEHLQRVPAELQELVEAVVVPETWFMRHPESFAALGRLAAARWAAHADKPAPALRLLSLPCSTGEEPYSMAIALLEAGVPAAQFAVDAVDVSGRALALARQARYERNALRGSSAAFCDRYFRPEQQRLQLHAELRRQVRFSQGNLLSLAQLAVEPPYDFVFCRNVLIYFDRPTQQQALGVLAALLAPGSVLFVGPAETALLRRHDYESLHLPLAFAFRRLAGTAARAAPPPPPRRAAPRAGRPPVLSASRPSATSAASIAALGQPSGQPSPLLAGLAQASLLADRGQLDAAQALCMTLLREQAHCADAYQLLGLIHDARGESEQALVAYRKVLYLQPDHEQALLHLGSLLHHRGDTEAARCLRERAQRLHPNAKWGPP